MPAVGRVDCALIDFQPGETICERTSFYWVGIIVGRCQRPSGGCLLRAEFNGHRLLVRHLDRSKLLDVLQISLAPHLETNTSPLSILPRIINHAQHRIG